MFKPKYLKEAKLLCKGATKFCNYKRDVLAEGREDEIQGLIADLKGAMKSRDKEAVAQASEALISNCDKAAPSPSNPSIRENVEVIFVALVIAVGVRTYFLQPFRIPTGSMQPTLNGIIGHPIDQWPDGKPPGIVTKAFHKVWYGRTYVEALAPKAGKLRAKNTVTEHKFLRFFTYSRIHFEDGTSVRIGVPRASLMGGLGLDKRISSSAYRESVGPQKVEIQYGAEDRLVAEGQLLARGYVDTGDQVFVNKLAYHFRVPKRGEVFVFNTTGIRGIENRADFDRRFGSQHYIKRLVALPGDSYAVESPQLMIDGEVAQEFGMQRVMGLEEETEGYNGYGAKDRFGNLRSLPYDSGVLGGDQYMAMGDNSYHSSDGREWGPVPEDNLVGPGLLVYWPFGHNFGLIK